MLFQKHIPMKNLLLVLIVFFMLPSHLSEPSLLTVEITGLRSSDGQVILQLSDENDKELEGIHQAIIDNKCIIKIRNLNPGKYAFRYFHDENNNNELDQNWIGIPKEGYGFSNNAKSSIGAPDFEDMIFILGTEKTMVCTPNYIF